MGYQSQRNRISEIIQKSVIQFLKQKDLDYYKVLDEVCNEIGCSKSIAEDVLKTFISSGKIKEIRILTIPDEKVQSWFEEMREREKETKEDLNKVEEYVKDGGDSSSKN